MRIRIKSCTLWRRCNCRIYGCAGIMEMISVFLCPRLRKKTVRDCKLSMIFCSGCKKCLSLETMLRWSLVSWYSCDRIRWVRS
jgi:hypothetical protein